MLPDDFVPLSVERLGAQALRQRMIRIDLERAVGELLDGTPVRVEALLRPCHEEVPQRHPDAGAVIELQRDLQQIDALLELTLCAQLLPFGDQLIGPASAILSLCRELAQLRELGVGRELTLRLVEQLERPRVVADLELLVDLLDPAGLWPYPVCAARAASAAARART